VSKELERLIKSELLVPVESSDWVTPIVSVVKPDKSIRFSGATRNFSWEGSNKVNLTLKKSKCKFFSDNVTFLGYHIDKEGVKSEYLKRESKL